MRGSGVADFCLVANGSVVSALGFQTPILSSIPSGRRFFRLSLSLNIMQTSCREKVGSQQYIRGGNTTHMGSTWLEWSYNYNLITPLKNMSAGISAREGSRKWLGWTGRRLSLSTFSTFLSNSCKRKFNSSWGNFCKSSAEYSSVWQKKETCWSHWTVTTIDIAGN